MKEHLQLKLTKFVNPALIVEEDSWLTVSKYIWEVAIKDIANHRIQESNQALVIIEAKIRNMVQLSAIYGNFSCIV